ncbi:Uncharacterised protein [uncultured archaeon]|nr:Uncharacterised protein [uncultured archaeon]
MTAPLEFNEMPELWVGKELGSKGIKGLIELSKTLSDSREFVLLLDYSEAATGRVLPAYLNAKLRVRDGISRSRSTQIEMLLLAAGTMNIDKAISKLGAKDPKKFLLFATSRPLMEKFVKNGGVGLERMIVLKINEDIAGEVALTEVAEG